MSELSVPLQQAYFAAHYRAKHRDQTFTLRISRHSECLRVLQEQYHTACSAFLMAWNPFSRPLSVHENRRRQSELLQDLDALSYPWLPGEGADPSGQWPTEESVLVLGLPCDEAIRLGAKFQQNALIWAGADAVPELLLLR